MHPMGTEDEVMIWKVDNDIAVAVEAMARISAKRGRRRLSRLAIDNS